MWNNKSVLTVIIDKVNSSCWLLHQWFYSPHTNKTAKIFSWPIIYVCGYFYWFAIICNGTKETWSRHGTTPEELDDNMSELTLPSPSDTAGSCMISHELELSMTSEKLRRVKITNYSLATTEFILQEIYNHIKYLREHRKFVIIVNWIWNKWR